MGPSQVPFPSGHLYYIVFVDDYTRVSWVYLIKDHRQVLDIVRQFTQEIITQHSTTPKVIRTGNALELVQSALQQFSVDHGIIHQTTCPYTSSQNGVAERKHRILLDITRTLLYEIYVPHYLWFDAIMTATYLHNWLPSSPLGCVIPLTRLFPNASLFRLPLRVFGCTAFVQDYTPSLSKLAPRALKEVFVGYSRTHKAIVSTSLIRDVILLLLMSPSMKMFPTFLPLLLLSKPLYLPLVFPLFLPPPCRLLRGSILHHLLCLLPCLPLMIV